MKLHWTWKPQWPDVVLIAGASSLLLVCLFLLAVPGWEHLQDRARLARLKSNALTLQLAAETYAYGHGGQYPLDALDLLTYLPGRRAPENPFTGEASDFRGLSGDLTYRSPRHGADYIIEAWAPGNDGQPGRLLVLSGPAGEERPRNRGGKE